MTPAGLNHHLWRNRARWWVAFTVIVDGYRQVRIRRSLATTDVEVARRRRDALIDEYRVRPGVTLAIRSPRRP